MSFLFLSNCMPCFPTIRSLLQVIFLKVKHYNLQQAVKCGVVFYLIILCYFLSIYLHYCGFHILEFELESGYYDAVADWCPFIQTLNRSFLVMDMATLLLWWLPDKAIDNAFSCFGFDLH